MFGLLYLLFKREILCLKFGNDRVVDVECVGVVIGNLFFVLECFKVLVIFEVVIVCYIKYCIYII